MPFFSDTFTDTDAVTLQAHTPTLGDSWTRLWGSAVGVDWAIVTNQATPDTDADDGSIYTADATYPSADYDLTFTLVGLGASTRPLYIFLRIQDQENMYAVRLVTGVALCQLYKKVSGTWTAIGSAFEDPATGSVCKLEIIGSTLKFYDDAVEAASVSDTDISAAGKAGIGAGGGVELVTSTDDSHTVNIIDDLSVNDLGAAGGDGRVFGVLQPMGIIF